MSRDRYARIARQLLSSVVGGATPAEIVKLFSAGDFEIASFEGFGKHDLVRQTSAIEATLDCNFLVSDPLVRHAGHRGSDNAVAALQAEFPDHAFSQIGSADALQNCGRISRAFGPQHEPRRITGLDVTIEKS